MPSSIASLRVSADCTRCKALLIQPEWSEWISPNKTIHIWNCPIYGNYFETIDTYVESVISDEKLMKDFLPNLLGA